MEKLKLNYEGFEQYLFDSIETSDYGGYAFKFDNYYGALVTINGFGITGDDTWNLEIVKFDEKLDAIISSDFDIKQYPHTIGIIENRLTNMEVRNYLAKIKEL